VPTGARGSSWPAPAPPADDTAEAAEVCRAWLRDYHAEQHQTEPSAPLVCAPRARWSPPADPEVLGAELALGDWRPSKLGAMLDGALTSLRAKVRE
jgi:hypothetical protein